MFCTTCEYWTYRVVTKYGWVVRVVVVVVAVLRVVTVVLNGLVVLTFVLLLQSWHLLRSSNFLQSLPFIKTSSIDNDSCIYHYYPPSH